MAIIYQLLAPSLTIVAPKPSVLASSNSKRCLSYTPTTSSFRQTTLRLSSKHAAKPITAILKDRKGFGGSMNCSDYWGSNLSSVWDDVVQANGKLVCPSTEDSIVAETEDDTEAVKEESTVAETKEETQVANILIQKIARTLGGKLSQETYMFIVEASFYAVVAIVSFALCQIVVSHKDLMNKLSSGVLFGRPLTQFVKRSMWKVSYAISELENLVHLLLYWYQIKFLIGFGRTKMKKKSKKQFITFDDVEGADAAKAELLEIVSCIKDDRKYKQLGAKLPRGVLLVGPPGTGKTLLARAVAGEANVAFFSVSASEFVEFFVGIGASRVRDLFTDARKCSPSIIFIDEIDAVGGQRGLPFNSERDQTLNQILTEMDGFDKAAKVVVIAATNRPGILDSALIRPGRFSRKVVVGVPDEDGRRKIFGLYLKEVPMKEDKKVICDLVASLTPGLVGADLENIVNESVLLAARRDGDFVTKEDVLEAVERAKTKICNDDQSTIEANSTNSFEQMAQKNVQTWSGSMGY